MRRSTLLVLACLAPSAAWAGDIGDALNVASQYMGDEITEGLEDFVDDEPDQALSILLWRRRGGAGPAPVALGEERMTREELRPFMDAAATETGLPVALIDAVIRTESGYHPRAVSSVGAQGLMQLMPQTAKEVGVRNAFDVRQNILGGSRYLKKMLDRFGSLRLAIAAYNAGPGAVERAGGVPDFRETRAYVQAVLARYEQGRVSGLK